jgi:RNA polymerase sigma factor (sigma-70 family)
VTPEARVDSLLRELAPQVVARLVRRYRDFDSCEDAVQEALLSAAQQWPVDGVPDNPRGWLITVAHRRLIEMTRSNAARRRREETAMLLEPPEGEAAPTEDDSLTLLMLCCHPALTLPSQVALTLRAVGGLTTAEIARAFLVPESTIGQRISRAKQRIKASGAEFRLPSPADRSQRIAGVLRVLYLIFNEGYTASSGATLMRVELTAEAVRLTRQLHEDLPNDGEVAGLLALMLLTDARRPARASPDGTLIPLAEQDRRLWDRQSIHEGTTLVTRTLAAGPVGPYQLQAAIAAVHAEAPRAEDTDWPQILGLYDLLLTLAPGPMIILNRIVAVAMVHGAEAGLHQLAATETDDTLTGHHRVDAVRAHLLEMIGDNEAARDAYVLAARGTLSIPEQRYLQSRAAALKPGSNAGRDL